LHCAFTYQPTDTYIGATCAKNAVIYAHLKAGLPVGLKQNLSQGDLIGYVGIWGNLTEPHLRMVSGTEL
jgi:murein DD-endopeptidase MepM/ murein hydrolase activator NlpD